MPLLQRDKGKGSGGVANENRRSIAEYFGYDTSLLEGPATSPSHRLGVNEMPSNYDWALNPEPGSPEAAQSPRSLVPANCFPPQHPRAFATHSEYARPGSVWSEDASPTSQGITDVVNSLNNLALAPQSQASEPHNSIAQASIHFHVSCPGLERTSESPRDERQNNGEVVRYRKYTNPQLKCLPRRASICGVMPLIKGEVLQWAGTLPPRCVDSAAGYSAKVFLGGLPWDMTEQTIMHTFQQFYPIRVEWPERDGEMAAPRGFAYVTFESERRVRALLGAARKVNGDWYYRVATRQNRAKDVQVIPWSVSESAWSRSGASRLAPEHTVFVGALHGCISARALAHIMNEVFSEVIYAGIDTDKNKYPIGSGRVTFASAEPYMRAVAAGYVYVYTDRFTKRLQLLPYLEDSLCSLCGIRQGPYFCRERGCYNYFCRNCWAYQHHNSDHQPLMRSSKGGAKGALALQSCAPQGQAAASCNRHESRMEGAASLPNRFSASEPAESDSHLSLRSCY